MTERARLFVEGLISENNIGFMQNILSYYISSRNSNEMLKVCFTQTSNSRDPFVIAACDYLNVIPPITQDTTDFSETLIMLIKHFFTDGQIEDFSNKEALEYLTAV